MRICWYFSFVKQISVPIRSVLQQGENEQVLIFLYCTRQTIAFPILILQ